MEVFVYCLVNNHSHLFVKEINNQKSGSLVGNRYKCKPIEDERYFFALQDISKPILERNY